MTTASDSILQSSNSRNNGDRHNEAESYGLLNFNAFANLSEKTLENWLRAHKIAYLEGGVALTGLRMTSTWKHPWTLVKEIEELICQQVDNPTVAVTSATLRPIIKAHINLSPWKGLLAEYARLGAKAIRLLGIDDKRQVTVVAAAAANGTSLPYQVVLTGNTKKCLPPIDDCKPLLDLGWSITWSDNHWSNLETSKLLFDSVHLLYFLEVKKLNLPEDYPAVYLIDVWGVHISEAFLTHLKNKAPWLNVKFILANCTRSLLKTHIVQSLPAYIMALHINMIKDGVPPEDQTVDLRTSALKPLLPMFLAHAFKRISEDNLVKNTWEKAGILKCFNADFQREAVRLAFSNELYPVDEQPPIVADNEPGLYDTLENEDDLAAEELLQQLQDLQCAQKYTCRYPWFGPRCWQGSSFQPRALWRIGKVEKLLQGSDGLVRGASLRVQSDTTTILLNRPLQHLYPLEIGAPADQMDRREPDEPSCH
eukprot:Em0018g22a